MRLLKDKKYFKILLLSFLIFLTTFQIKNFNIFNSFFKINNINFNKTLYLEDIIKYKIIDALSNDSLIFFDKKKIINLLQESPWIKGVNFKKQFPSNLDIEIEEYFPIGYFKENNQFFFINNGFLKAKANNTSNLNNFIKFNNITNFQKFKNFFKIVSKYESIISKIYEIRYISNDRWDLILKDKKIVKFGEYDLHNQISTLNLFVNNDNISIIDLRVKNRITISYVN